MSTRAEELAKRFLHAEWEKLSQPERRVIEKVLGRLHVARNTNREFLDTRTLGERAADRIATFGGSWTFIIIFLVFLVVWALLNTEILGPRRLAFDPYPYIFLNLMLSMLAALQAPIIMMSQNRQAARDRLDAANDYEVNLKAEIEIRALHEKIDALREAEWAALVAQQQEQIRLLNRLVGERERGEAG